MRTAVLALCLLSAVAAFGQVAGGGTILSNQPQVMRMGSHSEHASAQSLGREQSLLSKSGFAYGKGERPLWEVGTVPTSVPMGDVARTLRKEHESAPKAVVIWEN